MVLGAIAAFALLFQAPSTPAGRLVRLDLPHALRTGESVFLEITTGVLKRGTEIVVQTDKGQTIGKISPFVVPSGREAGTYTVPVPKEAVSGNRVSIRLVLTEESKQRAPSEKEVKDVRLRLKIE